MQQYAILCNLKLLILASKTFLSSRLISIICPPFSWILRSFYCLWACPWVCPWMSFFVFVTWYKFFSLVWILQMIIFTMKSVVWSEQSTPIYFHITIQMNHQINLQYGLIKILFQIKIKQQNKYNSTSFLVIG